MEFSNKNRETTFQLITFIFIVIQLLLHFFTCTNYELHRDEMLYFNMGDHLDFGYLTIPPVTGFLAHLVKLVFGYSVFGIRFIPALLGAATLFIIAKIVYDLGGGIFALSASLITFLFLPGYLLIFSLFTPNAVEIFLWTLFVYLIYRLLVTEDLRLWLWISIVAGISFNTKYSVVFLISGFLAAFLVFRKHKLFFSKWFLMGLVAGLFIILPNIVWQYNHNWPVVFHMQELGRTQLSNLSYLHFFIDLFSLNSAFITVWLSGLIAMILSKSAKGMRFLGVAHLIVFLLFIMSKGKAYYVLGLLPFLIAYGGCLFERYLKLKYFLVPVIVVLTIYSLFTLPYVLPVLSLRDLEKYSKSTRGWVAAPFMRWEDGTEHKISQIFADMTGWKELAERTALAYSRLDTESQKDCWIYCQRSYGYAGAIHFYGRQYNLPEPVTFHESYVFWAPDTIPNGPLIYVFYNNENIKQYFEKVIETGTIQNPFFWEKGLKVYLCLNAKTDIQKVYHKLANDEKGRFQK